MEKIDVKLNESGLHDIKSEVRDLFTICNILIDKVNGLIDSNNKLEELIRKLRI